MKPLLIAAVASIALMGCDLDRNVEPGEKWTEKSHSSIVVIDGVMCVKYVSYRKAGLSCNWEAYNKGDTDKGRF